MEMNKMPELEEGHIEWVNKQADYLRLNFEATKAIMNRPMSPRNLQAIFACFYNIISIAPMMITPLYGTRILRARTYDHRWPLYTSQTEISYNKTSPHKIKLGRFNRKGEPLFYGSLPTDSDKEDYLLSCALECCKELTDLRNPVKVQDLAIGGWLVEKELYVINLCNDKLHLSDNLRLKHGTERFLKTIEENFSPEIYKFIHDFTAFYAALSRLRTSRKEIYYTLCALLYALRHYYHFRENKEIEGLIYPGAMSEGKGLNVVLTPEASDAALRLDKVLMYRHILDKHGRNQYYGDKVSDIVDVDQGHFTITNYIPPGGGKLNL